MGPMQESVDRTIDAETSWFASSPENPIALFTQKMVEVNTRVEFAADYFTGAAGREKSGVQFTPSFSSGFVADILEVFPNMKSFVQTSVRIWTYTKQQKPDSKNLWTFRRLASPACARAVAMSPSTSC